jgi:hypothetical protein
MDTNYSTQTMYSYYLHPKSSSPYSSSVADGSVILNRARSCWAFNEAGARAPAVRRVCRWARFRRCEFRTLFGDRAGRSCRSVSMSMGDEARANSSRSMSKKERAGRSRPSVSSEDKAGGSRASMPKEAGRSRRSREDKAGRSRWSDMSGALFGDGAVCARRSMSLCRAADLGGDGRVGAFASKPSTTPWTICSTNLELSFRAGDRSR